MPKLKDGLPRKSFAYAPSADPSTWKLPIYKADGSVDSGRLPAAVAAIGEGFRGEKVDLPSGAVGAVKAKLRSAYRRWKGSDVEYPDGIKEVALVGRDGTTFREATIMLDKGMVPASLVFTPSGDTLVVPAWDGQFFYAAKPFEPPSEVSTYPQTADWSAKYDAQDASRVLTSLIDLKSGEEAPQQAMIDKAITGITDFIKAETAEIPPNCPDCDHLVGCDCTVCDCTNAGHGAMTEARVAAVQFGLVAFREAGKRNSAGDEATMKQIIALVKSLGVGEDQIEIPADGGVPEIDGTKVPALQEVMVEVASAAADEIIRFRESSHEHANVVTLAEADPVFDASTRSIWLTPIQSGWGNARDNFYYPTDTIREATVGGMFNGLKMFKNHPRKSDEKDLPERDVTDWFATTKESQWDEARQRPRVRAVIHEAEVFDRFQEVPEQIAFSIIGGGHAKTGRVNGRDGRVVESFTNVNSVDWVTEAGAGGAIDFAESAAEEFEMKPEDIAKMTPEQLKEAAPGLYAAIKEQGTAEGEAETPAAPAAPAAPTDAPAAPAEPAAAPAENPNTGPTNTPTEPVTDEEPVAESAPAWAKALIAKVDKISEADEARERTQTLDASKARAKALLVESFAESTLTSRAKNFVAGQFTDVTIGEGGTYADETAFREAVTERLGSAADFVKAMIGEMPSSVRGLGGAAGEGDDPAERSATMQAIESRWGDTDAPAKMKTVYQPGEELGNLGDTAVIGGPSAAVVAESGAAAKVSEGAAAVAEALGADYAATSR